MNILISRILITFSAIAMVESCSTQTTAQEKPVPMRSTLAQGKGSPTRCLYQGRPFSEGAVSCQSNIQYRCDNGRWVSTYLSCGTSPVAAARPCQFSGISFSTGSTSCQNDNLYRCEDGVWQDMSTVCSSLGTSPIVPSSGARTCMFSGATVATNSTICKEGSTYLCSDGEWINLGWSCH